MSSTHDWQLVAPWWFWPVPGTPERGRHTAPQIQKYDTPKLVETFLDDPQRRLLFMDAVDRVVRYTGNPAGLGGVSAEPTSLRKLFLPSHHRHYLVTCALHCDAPGFPAVDRKQVCQVGFVVRRRKLDAGAGDLKDARKKLYALSSARRALANLDTQIAAARAAAGVAAVRLAALQVRRDATVKLVAGAADEVRSWAEQVGVTRKLEGWYSGPNDGEGHWAATPELPDDVTEEVFPLYPLMTSTAKDNHDADGQAIWFGLVPAGASEHYVDADGACQPRFDDQSAYEIRCFARPHDQRCPARPDLRTRDCRGELVWSEPTEPYGLAGFHDIRGTAHRPVTVVLPDLAALKAQAGTSGFGVQFKAPPHSQIDADGPSNGSFQICSFSIPLITIVATFVFRLFLPIVVFVFQLWFLLLLKFCIPPELQVSDGLSAALDISPPQLEVDAALQAQFDAGTLGAIANALKTSKPGDTLFDPNDADSAFRSQDRIQRRSMLRLLFGVDELAQPVDDRVYAPRVERTDVVPA